MTGLISINKPHTDNIFSGEKRIEWRKSPLPEGLYYVYETKNKGGCGMIIGQMRIVGSKAVDTSKDMIVGMITSGKVHPAALREYAKNGVVYANYIKAAKRYTEPKPLGNYMRCPYPWDCGACDLFDGLDMSCNRKIRPPQSWCRL